MNEVPVHLLRETLQAHVPAGPPEACLDAETVAAWADDTLGRDERRAAEAHTADCGRCQALVAAMVRTAPPTARRSWWRAPMMGWLVPLTAAAAALLLWTIVPGTPTVPSSASISRAIEQAPPRPAQAAEVSTKQPQSRLLPAAKPEAAKERRGTNSAARNNAQGFAIETSPNEAPPILDKAFSEAASATAAPAPAPTTPAMPVAPASPQPSADSVAAGAPPVTVQPTAAARFRSGIASGLLVDARRSPAVILSPNASSQWRILPSGAVQHSTDSGSTWEMQSTGVTAMLTTGTSPAPSICWLVGREGTVLLSTDGRSWRRLAFPEATDLASILATDDKSAWVTTVDGRAFRTTDGGQTWTR